MATTRRKKKRGLGGRLAIGGLKLGGGGTVGALIGATEEGAGEGAGQLLRGALAVAGFASEVFLDDKSPVLKAAGNAALYGASSVTGYKLGKDGMARVIETKRNADTERMRQDLKGDAETAAAEPATVASKKPASRAKG